MTAASRLLPCALRRELREFGQANAKCGCVVPFCPAQGTSNQTALTHLSHPLATHAAPPQTYCPNPPPHPNPALSPAPNPTLSQLDHPIPSRPDSAGDAGGCDSGRLRTAQRTAPQQATHRAVADDGQRALMTMRMDYIGFYSCEAICRSRWQEEDGDEDEEKEKEEEVEVEVEEEDEDDVNSLGGAPKRHTELQGGAPAHHAYSIHYCRVPPWYWLGARWAITSHHTFFALGSYF